MYPEFDFNQDFRNRNYQFDFLNLLRATEKVFKLKMERAAARKPNSATNHSWLGSCIEEADNRKFYNAIKLGIIVVRPGNHILIRSAFKGGVSTVVQVQYLFEDSRQTPKFHGSIFHRGSETILGDLSNEQELFISNYCSDFEFLDFVKKIKITYRRSQKSWKVPTDGRYFCSKRYEGRCPRFTEYFSEPNINTVSNAPNFCKWCENTKERTYSRTPTLIEDGNYKYVHWKTETYQVGTSVLLDPSVFDFKGPKPPKAEERPNVDEEVYPEYYRKERTNKAKIIPQPFCIGIIKEIFVSPKASTSIGILVKLFYRPENTVGGLALKYYKDIHGVYFGEKEIQVKFDKVAGRCHLRYFDIREEGEKWCSEGPLRFYSSDFYDPSTCDFYPVPEADATSCRDTVGPKWPKMNVPLTCMDIFAGCGGFSEGFRQAGLSETKWAIEMDTQAAAAFQANHPDCKVIRGDCKKLINDRMANRSSPLPNNGEVDILVGGPPCQGFSSLNRYSERTASQTSNSLLETSIDYCQYYRPKYFILENVRHLTAPKNLKLVRSTIKQLLDMNYQVVLSVLQAGNYGLPQSRRRLFLLAAASGYILPKLPEPLTCFDAKEYLLSFTLEDATFKNDFRSSSAPYASLFVKDAIGDLPLEMARNDDESVPYEPVSPDSTFQRKMRSSNETKVSDHYTRKMSPLDMLRISHIPREPLADWRDLPNNLLIKLPDGKIVTRLLYEYRRQDLSRPPKGVCTCAIDGKCSWNASACTTTLIPYHLAHTADRNNHWSGAYGRLDYWGHFGTTLTKPDPNTAQGRVIHPEADRTLTIRECARSQGFPDHYQFRGTTEDKYRQIGNAVPPPLAVAIAKEIIKAYLMGSKSLILPLGLS